MSRSFTFHRPHRLTTALALAFGSVISAATAAAATEFNLGHGVAMDPGRSLAVQGDVWTPLQYQEAAPVDLPQADFYPVDLRVEPASLPEQLSEVSSGAPPTEEIAVEAQPLFAPDDVLPVAPTPAPRQLAGAAVGNDRRTPQDVGTYHPNARFTSQRLVPLSADLAYPYRAVGKLFFTVPDGRSGTCSAAVISRRLVLTAGHCVHSGNNQQSGWHRDFRFVPAYRDGAAPYGTWGYSWVITTTTWYSGGGGVPNAADYAILEISDQSIDGATRRIGEVTGWLGTATNSLTPNHAYLLGYPAAFDNGAKMHQVAAQSLGTYNNNTALYGSDMTGGSSGGPWIKNFGDPADGQSGGLDPTRNQVVGVTSFGFTDPAPKMQGSSILDTRFSNASGTGIFNVTCAHQAGNCQ